MSSLANAELPVFPLFESAFTTAATFVRAKVLGVAAILTTGRRTVTNLLRTVAGLTDGDPSSYHRVLSLAQWSGLSLAALLTRFLLRHFWPEGRVRLVGDDTVPEHPGRKVHGKARHRDPVRSSHSYTAWRWGHKWVVLAVLVQLPFARRPWALPVLVALYRSPQDNAQRGRPPKTPAQLLRLLLRWFPDRQFLFAGDQNYGSHAMARLAPRTAGRLHVVSKFPPQRRPVRAASALGRARPAARQGGQAAHAPGGGGDGSAHPVERGLVRRRPARRGGGQRHRALVQGGGGPGTGPLGVRP
jgi:hypothetical protein